MAARRPSSDREQLAKPPGLSDDLQAILTKNRYRWVIHLLGVKDIDDSEEVEWILIDEMGIRVNPNQVISTLTSSPKPQTGK